QYNEITNQNNCYPNNQILRSWSVKDECGNTFAVSQVLTVIDTTPPTFTVPPTKVVKYYDDFDNLAALGDVTDEADNCTESLEAFYYDILPEEIDYFDTSYLIQRVWQASDECGNITQKTQNIF